MKKILSLGIALTLSFILVNGAVFFYERPVGWIDTPNGASRAVRNPYSMLVHGTEGYGISRIDKNGFTNPDYPLSDKYILMMGASHSQGKEIHEGKKYSVIINNLLTNGKEELSAINISCDGHFLPSIINHFQAAVINYPRAKCITIEIGSTDYTIEELTNAVFQPEEIDTRNAEQIFSQQNLVGKLKNSIKEYFPLVSLIKNHIQTARDGNSSKEYSVNEVEYKAVIIKGLSLIRSEYSGPIAFVYHPDTVIEGDGSLSVSRSKTIDIFKEACEDNGIGFIDVGDLFLEYYNEYQELPYGFSNTTPGNGHLNEIGHQIMAEAILDYLEEVNCK